MWMRLLCVAAAHEPIGYVAVAGKGLDEAALARLTGCPEAELAGLLGELERNRVFSRDRHGRIYSRRMIADARKARLARRNGLKGGNPSLSNDSAKSPRDKGADNGRVKPRGRAGDKPQSPDSQNPESREKALAFSGRAGAPKERPGWHRPKTHLDAANSIIEEINDSSRIAAGGQGPGGDVLMLPAVGAR
ncbi:MAG: hypothetical protein EOS22_33025 [Mesorhizobium sp.]|nr:MAG: hypothetical protein EOS53_23530 [Mesorhizobium sp.]RWD18701.1 MAG: hypothetical protein EOS22_33025 [Mesorhizobium sp.]TJW57628.1 MAG: hypothetical protein E5V29_32555 [Mesorhizobium sp.]